jgi:hypothetical protein
VPDPAGSLLMHKLCLVRAARITFGPDRARSLWEQLGLPTVPAAAPTCRDDALACLRHLLDAQMTRGSGHARTIRQCLDDAFEALDVSAIKLDQAGIRVYPARLLDGPL